MNPCKHYINAFSLFFIFSLNSMESNYQQIILLPSTTTRPSTHNVLAIAKEYLSIANPFAIVSQEGLSHEGQEIVFGATLHTYAFTIILGVMLMMASSSFMKKEFCAQGFVIGGSLAIIGLINGIRSTFAIRS